MEGRTRPMALELWRHGRNLRGPLLQGQKSFVRGRSLYVKYAGADGIDGAERCMFSVPLDLKVDWYGVGAKTLRIFGGT